MRITASAICGTDLHFVRGTFSGMQPGTILGHEGVGIVEELGEDVRNLKVGDRVVIPSTIACGNCAYCRAAISPSATSPTRTASRPAPHSTAGLRRPARFHGLSIIDVQLRTSEHRSMYTRTHHRCTATYV